jgi:hypothetical protein
MLLLLTGGAQAADKALILNEQEQRDLVTILDAATKAQGLAIAASTLRLLYKLQSAGVVQEPPKPESEGGHDTK